MSSSERRLRRFILIIFLLVTYFILLVALANLVWNIWGPWESGYQRPELGYSPIRNVIPGNFGISEQCPDNGVALTIRINQLQPSDGTMAVTLEFRFSDDLRQEINEYNNLAAERGIIHPYTMLFEVYDGNGHKTETETVSQFRGTSFGSSCDPDFILNRDLPLIATSQNFPNDWYYYNGSFDLSSWNNSMFAPGVDKFTQDVQATTALSSYVINSGGGSLKNHLIEIGIARSPLTILYVYCIAISPLFLYFVSFFMMHFSIPISGSNNNSTNDGIRDGTKFVLELAVALIAVISLRQVFVPTDIQGFTRIDYLFAAEVAVAIFCSIVYAAYSQWILLKTHEQKIIKV